MKTKLKKIIALLLALVLIAIPFSTDLLSEAGDYTGETFTLTETDGSTLTVYCDKYDSPAVGTITNKGSVIMVCSSSAYQGDNAATPFMWSPSEVSPVRWTEADGAEAMRSVFFAYYHGAFPAVNSTITANMNFCTDVTAARKGNTPPHITPETAPYSTSFAATESGSQSNDGTTQKSKTYTLNTGSAYYYTKVSAPAGVTINYYSGSWQTATGSVNLPTGTQVYFTTPNSTNRTDNITFSAVLSDGSTAYYLGKIKTLTADRQLSDFGGGTSYDLQVMAYPEVNTPSYTKSVTWTPAQGNIKIVKSSNNTTVTGSNGAYSLAGAVYGIYRTTADANADTNRVGTITTDAAGNGTSGSLNYGTYYVKEITAPKGFVLDGAVYTATVGASTPTPTVNSTDNCKYDPSYIILKKNDEDGVLLKGAVFEINYYDVDPTINPTVDPATEGKTPARTWRLVTDADGFASIREPFRATASNPNWTYDSQYEDAGMAFYTNTSGDPILPVGKITIKEIKAPIGYKVDNTVYVRTVTQDGNVETVRTYNAPTITENPIPVRLSITKTGTKKTYNENGAEQTQTAPLANVQFDIMAETDCLTWEGTVKYHAGDLVETITTDAAGNAKSTSQLYFGKYKVVEKATAANEDYELMESKVIEVKKSDIEDENGNMVAVLDNDGYLTIDMDVENQPKTPKIKTTAWDSETKTNTASKKEILTLTDTVSYTNLIPGKTYELTTYVYDKKTGLPLKDKNGNEIKKTGTFTPAAASGTTDVSVTIERELIKDTQIVFFEYVKKEGDREYVAIHADINDNDQTIDTPSGHTTMLDKKTKTHNVLGGGEIELVDTIEYEGLHIGETYEISSKLMLKSTKAPLKDKDGKEIIATTSFTPSANKGKVDVTFKFDATNLNLEGETIVCFETIYSNGVEVYTEADIDNPDQSVYVPKVTTSAICSETGSRTGVEKGTATIVDGTTLDNLLIGQKYYVEGVLIDKRTKKPVLGEDKKEFRVKSDVFTADKASKVIEMVYSGDAEYFKGREVVVYEYLYIVNADGTASIVGRECDRNDLELNKESGSYRVDIAIKLV